MKRKATKAEKLAILSTKTYEELLEMFKPYIEEDQESAQRPPATDEEIASAEERLGIELPDDLKAFYRASNGMEFVDIPDSMCMPGIRSIEDLDWAPAKDLGLSELLELDEFQYDAGRPKGEPGQVLMLGDDGYEESLWYIEPSEVDRANGEWKKR